MDMTKKLGFMSKIISMVVGKIMMELFFKMEQPKSFILISLMNDGKISLMEQII